MENEVRVKTGDGEEIKDRVETWLPNVKRIIERHDHYNANQVHTRCCNDLFPNPMSRYTLAKQANDMAQKVDKIRNAMPDITSISQKKPLLSNSTLSTDDYESFDSRKEIIDKVKEKLKDFTIRMI